MLPGYVGDTVNIVPSLKTANRHRGPRAASKRTRLLRLFTKLGLTLLSTLGILTLASIRLYAIFRCISRPVFSRKIF